MNVNLRSAMTTMDAIKKAEPELAKLKKATDGFEAVFLKKLFSQMRSSVKETQFGQTFGKEIYNDMFDEALANAAAKSKTLGMGDLLYRQMAPKVVRSIGFQPMRPSTFQVEAPAPSVDSDSISKPGVHDLEGRATHGQDAYATPQMRPSTFQVEAPALSVDSDSISKSVLHDQDGRATHRQDVDATPKP